MPDYVYALHDFAPEHEDEVSFKAGEPIEVVERDDVYNDGWWQGRNLSGKVGLFPVSYTSSGPPPGVITSHSQPLIAQAEPTTIAKTPLQPLTEESETESQSQSPSIVSPVPKPPPVPSFLSNGNGDEDYDPYRDDTSSLHLATDANGEVMKATMTDVQKAIEQLGRGSGDGDGARSFSFASTRDGADTETDETDFDLSDLDVTPDKEGGEDWHKNARRKLAAKARRAVEEAEKLEAMMNGGDGGERREVVPPIEAELSDESDGEGEDFARSKFHRHQPNTIHEEDENGLAHIKEDTELIIPPKTENEEQTATATKTSFTVFPARVYSPPPMVTPPTTDDSAEKSRAASPVRSSYPTPVSPAVAPNRSSTPGSKRDSIQQSGLPSPSPSHFHPKHQSMRSTSSAPGLTMPTPSIQEQTPVAPSSEPSVRTDAQSKTHPSEWTVDEVVEWLKGKKFDQDVCDKFIEQEITGDVLLELDVNLLKTEIGIMAFGKRMRIANAITELRRPPSIQYSDHQPPSEHPPPSPMMQYMHSRTHSQSLSHHSFPGTITTGHSIPAPGYPLGPSSNLPSPMGYGHNNNNGHFGPLQEDAIQSIEVQNGFNPAGVAAAPGVVAGIAAAAGVGLGIAMSPPPATPPVKKHNKQLSMSPSDGALKDTAAKASLSVPPTIEDEERGHMSDGDIVPTNMSVRRRLFGRSHDSSAISISNSRASKESPMPSPTVQNHTDKDTAEKEKEKEKDKKDKNRDSSSIGSGRRHSKRSVDAKDNSRLSIFGGTFGGSLSKNRKPPPPSTSTGEDVPVERPERPERHSKFSLPRLGGSSIRKASSTSHRPLTPTGSPRDFSASFNNESPSEKEEGAKARATLRKRTTSAPGPSPPNTATGFGVNGGVDGNGVGVGGPVKQGQNIWDQIGEPDHAGWMRKKGDRYSTWKLRYCILKGPHMYILRSNNKAETRLKGYIHIPGYKVTVDENVDPGRYGFRIDHDHDKTHYFSSEEKVIIREWMKAIMKATIGRDYSKPVVSSCNIPTIPLVVAQAMNPAPRPPSPMARDATQRAMRRDNPDQLSSRDARVLMGLPSADGAEPNPRIDTFFNDQGVPPIPSEPTWRNSASASVSAPPRPSREMRRSGSQRTTTTATVGDDLALIDWANSHLPEHLQIQDPNGPLCSGLGLLRLAESIKGKPSSPPVPDSAFPLNPHDDKLDGLFRLFDFLLDNDVKMGSVSINDVRQGKREKIVQLVKALRVWEDKRRAVEYTIGRTGGGVQAGGFLVPVVM